MTRKSVLNMFGIGHLPFSASLASLVVIPGYYLISLHLPNPVYINVALFLSVVAWSMVELHRDSAYAKADPREVVVDEFLGMHSTLIIACTCDPVWIVVLFVLFRVFDRFKMFPANVIERKLKGTYGLLWDDIAIGVSIGILYRFADRLFLHELGEC